MKKEKFGVTNRGEEVTKYTLENRNGMKLSVIDLGASIVSIRVPAADGSVRDVVLGYDDPAEYQKHTFYFGACIGRSANRIAHAACVLDGVNYALEDNDHGNHLHSGANGFHDQMFTVREEAENAIAMTIFSRDMEQGLPGNLTVTVTYTLTEDNEVVICYKANTDRATVVNLTNHSYFNLNGHDSGSIEGQELMLFSSHYTPVADAKSIPTGEIVSVKDTPMDFTKNKAIGQDINAEFDQLKFVGGYDHNFMVDGEAMTIRLAARAFAPESRIAMEVYTDLPAIQFYTGNFITPHMGKEGAAYDFRHGFCLETQYVPDAVNQPVFASPVLKPEHTYYTTTIYKFM